MSDDLFDWIGYSASLFIVLSFAVNKLKQVRIINSIGCLCFVIYGIYFKIWPVVLPNAILIFIQMYYLLYKDKINAK